jgi:hypothetical protein
MGNKSRLVVGLLLGLIVLVICGIYLYGKSKGISSIGGNVSNTVLENQTAIIVQDDGITKAIIQTAGGNKALKLTLSSQVPEKENLDIWVPDDDKSALPVAGCRVSTTKDQYNVYFYLDEPRYLASRDGKNNQTALNGILRQCLTWAVKKEGQDYEAYKAELEKIDKLYIANEVLKLSNSEQRQ